MAAFVDDQEEANFEVAPSDNVYAYFMFAPPTETAKEGGGFTWDVIMAYVLLFLNFFMQGFLLMIIYEVVVSGNMDWQKSIVNTEGGGLDLLGEQKETCNMGGSLCFPQNSSISCAPPSVQLTGRWEELDTNGDGVWTREEVEKAQKELQCKYVVNPVEVFDVFINFLKTREKILWLHPDVKEGKAIPKPYFWFAAGDIIMCGYRNELMCPNLLKRGNFHAPLKHHTAPRVGKTIDSALEYCYQLLKPGGTCQQFLPSTYSVWKISSESQCKAPEYEKFVYKNPGSGVQKSLLEVGYGAVAEYENAQTQIFIVYKCVIISMWFLAMLVELKDITIITTWVIRFPSDSEFGDEAIKKEEGEDGAVSYVIQGISSSHRTMVGIMVFCRFMLTCVLTVTGISFLLKQNDYVGLLMDAVALVFIVEIAGLLYSQILRPEIREQVESLEPMSVPMFGIDSLNRRPALVDMICLVSIFIATIATMHWWYSSAVGPISDALNCACLSQGDKCLEADKFSYDFWHKYWKEDVPAVFKAVAELKKNAGAAASVLLEMGQHRFNKLPTTLLSAGANRLQM